MASQASNARIDKTEDCADIESGNNCAPRSLELCRHRGHGKLMSTQKQSMRTGLGGFAGRAFDEGISTVATPVSRSAPHVGSCSALNDHGTFKGRCGVRCLSSQPKEPRFLQQSLRKKATVGPKRT